MNWDWKFHSRRSAISACKRWVITELGAARFELWDNKEKLIVGVFPTFAQAANQAQGDSDGVR